MEKRELVALLSLSFWLFLAMPCVCLPFVIVVLAFSKAVVLLLIYCLLLLPLWESVIVLCFVVRNFISILVLQSSIYTSLRLPVQMFG